MVKTLAVNSDNDLFIGPDGNLTILSGLDAVLQICAQVSRAQLGEMVLNVDQGLPNFQTVWVGSPNIPQFESALRTALINVSGVLEVRDVAFDIQKNVLLYTAIIITKFGQGALNGSV